MLVEIIVITGVVVVVMSALVGIILSRRDKQHMATVRVLAAEISKLRAKLTKGGELK